MRWPEIHLRSLLKPRSSSSSSTELPSARLPHGLRRRIHKEHRAVSAPLPAAHNPLESIADSKRVFTAPSALARGPVATMTVDGGDEGSIPGDTAAEETHIVAPVDDGTVPGDMAAHETHVVASVQDQADEKDDEGDTSLGPVLVDPNISFSYKDRIVKRRNYPEPLANPPPQVQPKVHRRSSGNSDPVSQPQHVVQGAPMSSLTTRSTREQLIFYGALLVLFASLVWHCRPATELPPQPLPSTPHQTCKWLHTKNADLLNASSSHTYSVPYILEQFYQSIVVRHSAYSEKIRSTVDAISTDLSSHDDDPLSTFDDAWDWIVSAIAETKTTTTTKTAIPQSHHLASLIRLRQTRLLRLDALALGLELIWPLPLASPYNKTDFPFVVRALGHDDSHHMSSFVSSVQQAPLGGEVVGDLCTLDALQLSRLLQQTVDPFVVLGS